MVITVYSSQDGVVERGGRPVRAFCGAVGTLGALAAKDLLEGGTHFLVPVGVDDGVHGRIEFSKQEEELFIRQNVALRAANIKEQ